MAKSCETYFFNFSLRNPEIVRPDLLLGSRNLFMRSAVEGEGKAGETLNLEGAGKSPREGCCGGSLVLGGAIWYENATPVCRFVLDTCLLSGESFGSTLFN